MTVKIEGLGNITASKDALAKLSILAFTAAEKYHEDDCPALASKADEIAKAIYVTLNEKKYYDK